MIDRAVENLRQVFRSPLTAAVEDGLIIRGPTSECVLDPAGREFLYQPLLGGTGDHTVMQVPTHHGIANQTGPRDEHRPFKQQDESRWEHASEKDELAGQLSQGREEAETFPIICGHQGQVALIEHNPVQLLGNLQLQQQRAKLSLRRLFHANQDQQ